MPTFSYSARDAAGQSHNGTLTVDTRESLVAQLRGRGLTPTAIAESGGAARSVAAARSAVKSRKPPQHRISPGELVVITRQLATIVNAGLPLMQGLDILAEQSENPKVQIVLRQIAADVEAGESFSDALRKR